MGNILLASMIKPIIKPPAAFTISVPAGKPLNDSEATQVIAYLKAVPIKPPNPMAKSLFILTFISKYPYCAVINKHKKAPALN
jgi:hypothetical protein